MKQKKLSEAEQFWKLKLEGLTVGQRQELVKSIGAGAMTVIKRNP